ncbi:MAG: OmpA family protein [Deltaproteobacteria bacterium]|nr:OmpA family protein [Deltaproteobacteria bacterium]MBW1873532.1 OmpA family protein [Deltaproteobacteria bacterium]
MAKKKGKGFLVAAMIWLAIIGALAVAARCFILPYFKTELEDETGSKSRYKKEVIIAADSFSGYCVFRSPILAKELKSQGIKLTIQDDNADYAARMKALKKGKIQLAVFTIDSFIAAGAKLGKFPATIVMVIDETKGADAVISYSESVSSIQDLDHADARIVLTPQSPSEFLARTIIAHFSLPSLPEKWWIEADGASEVYRKFMAADHGDKRAYVLWEPYVSKALEAPGAHLLLDSSKLKGYIVDVLVAEREFLRDNPETVKAVIATYFRASYSYSQKTNGMQALVLQDAKATGTEDLTEALSEKLVQGIEWKNTLENYAYFGLLSVQDAGQLQHLEDVIANITDVLVKTGTIDSDPLGGKANKIFFDKIVGELQAADFHPAKKLNVIEGVGLGPDDLEQGRVDSPLRALSDEEWDKLVPVGQMRIKPISFGRGTARINIQSQRDLDELADKLEVMPQYYVVVIGHARAEGDPEANKLLAQERADEAAKELSQAGVEGHRIKVKAAEPSQKGGVAQSVSFILGQIAY